MAIFSTLCFSVVTPVAKAAIGLGLDSTGILAVRLVMTTALLGGTILATRPGLARMDRRGLLACVGAGLLNGIGMGTYFLSLTRIDSSVAAMIFALNPIVLLGLLALGGEKFTYRNGVRAALGVAGVYLLIGPGGRTDWLGAALAFVSVVTVPVQLILVQRFLQDYDPRSATLYIVGTMTVVAAGWWRLMGAGWQAPGWQGWLMIVVMAVVGTYLARLAMFVAIQVIGSTQTGLLAPVETLMTVIWSVMFLSERLSTVQWAGGGLILLSTLLAVKRLQRVRWPSRVEQKPNL